MADLTSQEAFEAFTELAKNNVVFARVLGIHAQQLQAVQAILQRLLLAFGIHTENDNLDTLLDASNEIVRRAGIGTNASRR